MSTFTGLEKAALDEICGREADRREILKAQIAMATVIKRENSGAGFFTYLAVNHSLASIQDGKTVIGNVAAKIEGFEIPYCSYYS